VSAILDSCQGNATKTIEPGTVIFAEGTKDGTLCVLVQGEVEILKGDFQVNTVSESGAVFGEMSILLSSPHMATVRARTSCQVHIIQDGSAFLRSNSAVTYDLLQTMAARLQGVTNYLTNLNQYVHSM
jgi:CRP-like cAMP-binding protein